MNGNRPAVVCAWCNALMAAGSAPVSHGCCERCQAKINAEMDALESKQMESKPIDNHRLTNNEIAAQYAPMRPIAFVRSFSPNGTPCGVITCWNVYAILYAVEHANAADTVKVQMIDGDAWEPKRIDDDPRR